MSCFKQSSCTESLWSDHAVPVQKLHWFVHVKQVCCELFCTEHPLNYHLELQRIEFDSLGGAFCFCAATLRVPLLFFFFSFFLNGIVSVGFSKSSKRGGFVFVRVAALKGLCWVKWEHISNSATWCAAVKVKGVLSLVLRVWGGMILGSSASVNHPSGKK